MGSNERIKRLDAVLVEQELDAYLATSTSDIRWLTDFSNVFDGEKAHAMLVSSSGFTTEPRRLLHTDMRYSSAMRPQSDVVLDVLDEVRRPHSIFVVEQLQQLLADKAGSGRAAGLRIGIEADLPLSAYRALDKALAESDIGQYQLVELTACIEKLRAVKDVQEIASMKAAQQLNEAAFSHMLEFLKPGISEAEAAVELEYCLRRSGAQGLAFPCIVASAERSALNHAVPGPRRLEKGDFILMDFGARLDDYCSDMTRTVVLGKASERQQEIYRTVLESQLAALAMIKAGLDAIEPFHKVNQVFAEKGFGPITHGLGHGVGIDIHELPIMASMSEGKLDCGHVVTVEPGIYFEGYGGVRIEDFGVVTEDGFDNFTAATKELIEL